MFKNPAKSGIFCLQVAISHAIYYIQDMLDFNEYVSLVGTMNEWAKAYAAGTPSVPDNIYDRN